MATKRTSRKTKTFTTPKKEEQKKLGFFDYLRFGESYTSLILGILVVIIATVLLLSFVHNRQPNQQNKEELAKISQEVPLTIIPSTTVTITPTSVPTNAPTIKPTATVVPTKAVAKTPTITAVPTVAMKAEQKVTSGKTYTVVAGDSLWTIAEKAYQSGYNWVDIAKANNLTDPGDIHVGNKLILPQVAPKVATVEKVAKNTTVMGAASSQQTKITGTTYIIAHGDTLWNIAVRAYGDGYQWVKIAKANNLATPGLIHVGNTLKIPRN